jgi:predicted metal-dependent hydrolase
LKNTSQPLVRSIQLSEETILYILKFSQKAKHLRMQIKNRGELEVILPRGLQISDAEIFLRKKSEWVKKHINKRKQSGNKYYLLGEEIKVVQYYELFIKRHKISFKNDNLSIISPAGSQDKLEMIFENWLRRLAKKSLIGRVQKISDRLNFALCKVSIRSQKTRWGSCSTNGNLSFNYNLLRFRKEVVDYVIIHELCHLKEMNHSEKFWKLVEGFCPDYKKLRKELKDYSISIS